MPHPLEAQVPSFMLLPHFGIKPDDQIKLGAIIKHDKRSNLPNPEMILNKGAFLTATDPQEIVKTNWVYNSTDENSREIRLWADILSIQAIGGGIEIGNRRAYGLRVHCREMKTTWFNPSKAELIQACEDPRVANVVKSWPRGTDVYLVAGLMVAEDATLEIHREGKTEWRLKIGVDGTGFGVPVSVGPEVGNSKSTGSDTTSNITHPFLLAYRLLRIRKSIRAAVGETPFTKYALFDDAEQANDEEVWEVIEFDESSRVEETENFS